MLENLINYEIIKYKIGKKKEDYFSYLFNNILFKSPVYWVD
jgi:hypothetical protein